MKVLMIERYLFPFGGVQTYMLAVADWLQKSGHEVEFFGMYHEKNTVGNSAGQYTRTMDFHNNSLSRFTYPFTIIYSSSARRKLSKVIDTFKPDIVHLHGFNFQLTPSVIYEVKKHGLPLIATVHDAQIACPCHRLYIEHHGKPCTACISGNYMNCMLHRCTSGSLVKSTLATMESYLYHWLKTYHMIDCFILPSQFMYHIMKTNGMDDGKMIHIQNFSRMNKPKRLKERTNERFVLYFGRLCREKGIETFVKVCRQMTNVTFKIAGCGPLESAFEGLPNVQMLGFMQGSELEDTIQAAALTIYPSEWYENCPMSVLESQMLGTPVVGARIGGIPELIEEGKSGLLFESGNADDLKQAIEKLLANDVLLKKMQAYCAAGIKLMDTDDYCKVLQRQYEILIEPKAISHEETVNMSL